MAQRTIDQKENGIISNIVATIICLFVGISLLGGMNKRGMLGNLIGGFIVIFVGCSLMGTISQELDNSFCGANYTNGTHNNTLAPNGATDSFGGGGAAQFGGYDGTVKHDSWLSNMAPLKTTEASIFSGDNCIQEGSVGVTMVKLVPVFFMLSILLAGLGISWSAFRNSGLL